MAKTKFNQCHKNYLSVLIKQKRRYEDEKYL